MNQKTDLFKRYDIDQILYSKDVYDILRFKYSKNDVWNMVKKVFYSALYTALMKDGVSYDCLIAEFLRKEINEIDYVPTDKYKPRGTEPRLLLDFMNDKIMIISGRMQGQTITKSDIDEYVRFIQSKDAYELMFK